METIELVYNNSSDIYEFSSKQVPILTSLWEGYWIISDKVGSTPLFQGNLIKNEDIKNEDSLVGEDFRKTYKIFENTEDFSVQFNTDVILGSSCTVSGKMSKIVNLSEVLGVEKYVTITLKGVFVDFSREVRVKTDINGEFSYDFNIGETIKTPENSFFIFQITPTQSELLEIGRTYILSAEVTEKDDSNVIIFRREVLVAKLKITP